MTLCPNGQLCHLDDESEDFVHHLIRGKGLGNIRRQEHQVYAGVLPFDILATYTPFEELAHVILWTKVLLHLSRSLLLHTLLFPPA